MTDQYVQRGNEEPVSFGPISDTDGLMDLSDPAWTATFYVVPDRFTANEAGTAYTLSLALTAGAWYATGYLPATATSPTAYRDTVRWYRAVLNHPTFDGYPQTLDEGKLIVGQARTTVTPSSTTPAPTSGLLSHIGDTLDAHDASAVSFVPTAPGVATNVQDAVAEAAAPRFYSLDAWNSDLFAGGANVWVTGQLAGTFLTVAGAVAAGSSTITVTNATGVLAGVVLLSAAGTGNQAVHRVLSVAGNVITFTAPIPHAIADGARIDSMWLNESHLSWSTGPGAGFGYLARWMFQAADALGIIDPTATKAAVLFNSWGAFDSGQMYADQWADLFPSAPALVLSSAGGRISSQILAHVDDLPDDVDLVFFNEPGVNDVYKGIPAADQARNLRLIVARIRARGMRPVYLGPVPLSLYPAETAAQEAAMVALIGDGRTFRATDLGDASIVQRPSKDTLGIGDGAFASLGSGGQGTAVGIDALTAATDGTGNVAVGARSLSSLLTGLNNVAVGYESGASLLNSGNTFVGYQAGKAPNNLPANASVYDSGCTFIGLQAGNSGTGTVQYGIAIGRRVTVGADGAFAIGVSNAGTPAVSNVQNKGVIGTAVHTVSIPGTLELGQIDAKGDLLAGTGNDTISKVTVGSDSSVLTADSTQTAGVRWKLPSRSLADVSTAVSVVNSTTETTMFTLALPTTLAAGDVVKVKAHGSLLSTTGTVTYTPRLKIGATTLTAAAISVAAVANRRSWVMDIDVLVVGTSDERLGVMFGIGQGGSSGVWAPANTASGLGYYGPGYLAATEDLTAGKNLVFTIQLGTAVATSDFQLDMATMVVLKR